MISPELCHPELENQAEHSRAGGSDDPKLQPCERELGKGCRPPENENDEGPAPHCAPPPVKVGERCRGHKARCAQEDRNLDPQPAGGEIRHGKEGLEAACHISHAHRPRVAEQGGCDGLDGRIADPDEQGGDHRDGNPEPGNPLKEGGEAEGQDHELEDVVFRHLRNAPADVPDSTRGLGHAVEEKGRDDDVEDGSAEENPHQKGRPEDARVRPEARPGDQSGHGEAGGTRLCPPPTASRAS